MTEKKKKKPEPMPSPPDIAGDHSATLARDEIPPAILALKGLPCPTCGTSKLGNRCEICGHQERDT